MSSRFKWIYRVLCIGLLYFSATLLPAANVSAADLSFSNLLMSGDSQDNAGDSQSALKTYLEADKLAPNNADILCRLAKVYCDLMPATTNKTEAKALAQKALICGLNAVKAEPQNAKAHVCVAICYAKQFFYSDNQSRVDFSRIIKAEAEKAIQLDPKYDLAYHMLGRWNYEVARMNFFVKGLVRLAYGGLPKASYEAAIFNFKKAIELQPNRIIHHLQLARMYHVTGQNKLVSAELKKCGDLTPMDREDREAQVLALKIAKDGRWPEQF